MDGFDRGVAERDDPAVVVPAVVEARDLLEVPGDAVRLALVGGERDEARELLQRAQFVRVVPGTPEVPVLPERN